MNEERFDFSIEALKKGDRETFARLVETTSAHIYRVALQILGNEQDAEDVLQETYIKALRALPSFEGRSSLTTWLYRIAVNEALMVLRKHKWSTVSIEENLTNEPDNETETLEIVDFCCLPESELLSSEAKIFLDEAILKLPQNLRIVFILRDLEGLSIQETAKMLKISENNVKTRLLRARLRLRQDLSQYYSEKVQEVKNYG